MKRHGPKRDHIPGQERLPRAVERRVSRRQKAERERRPLWFWLGMVGMVGWQVALPALLGAFLGRWLDERFPQTFSWTLTLLFLGLAIGCYNAWQWIRRSA